MAYQHAMYRDGKGKQLIRREFTQLALLENESPTSKDVLAVLLLNGLSREISKNNCLIRQIEPIAKN